MKYIYLIIVSAILVASGWFGRGILDGSLISIAKANESTQLAVKNALTQQRERDALQPKIEQSITATQNAAKIVPSKACPPGAGIMSDDVANSLRDAYGAPRR